MCGIEAAGAAHVEERDYRKFLVVLDKVDWAQNEGVLFVWDDLRPQPKDLLLQLSDEAFTERLPVLKTVSESCSKDFYDGPKISVARSIS